MPYIVFVRIWIKTPRAMDFNLPSYVTDVCDRFTVPVTLADPELEDCPLIYANTSFFSLSGHDAEDVLGNNCRFLSGAATQSSAREAIRGAIKDRKPITTCLINYRRDGSAFLNILALETVRLANGRELIMGCQKAWTESLTRLEIDDHARHIEDVLAALQYKNPYKHMDSVERVRLNALRAQFDCAVQLFQSATIRQLVRANKVG